MNFDNYDFYEFEAFGSEIAEAVMPVVAGIMALIVAITVIGWLISLVLYVLRSVSLHTISKRRGISNAWLSWIPVGQEWIIGSLSDQFKYLTEGKNQSRRKILLGLGIAGAVLGLFSYLPRVAAVVLEATGAGEYAGPILAASFAVSMVVGVVSFVVGVVNVVFRQMSLYELYRSCDPKNTVVFLVLGILFGVTEPFFLLACRNKDLGMPPRKGTQQAAAPEAAPAAQETAAAAPVADADVPAQVYAEPASTAPAATEAPSVIYAEPAVTEQAPATADAVGPPDVIQLLPVTELTTDDASDPENKEPSAPPADDAAENK